MEELDDIPSISRSPIDGHICVPWFEWKEVRDDGGDGRGCRYRVGMAKMWDENVTRSISVVSSSEVEKRETSCGAFSDNITGENTTARFEMFILL